MKIVNIDPKENMITGKYSKTLWYSLNADGFEIKFLEEVKSSLEKSGFPNLAVEEVTIKTGGFTTGYKNEQFEALQFYSKREDLEANRCCFSATQFGNVMHISIYFITNNEGGCAKGLSKLLSMLSGDGRKSLKEEEYAQAWQDFILMLLNDAIRNLPVQAAHDKDTDGSSGLSAKGLLGKLANLGS